MGTVSDLSAHRRRRKPDEPIRVTVTLSTEAWAILGQMAIDSGAHLSEVVERLVREAASQHHSTT